MGIYDFLTDREFVDTMQKTLKQVLSILLRHDISFKVVADTAMVDYEPSLPADIKNKSEYIICFELDGYTLSTVKVTDDKLSFEAGFGKDDFASIVSIPISAVLQIVAGDKPIFINMSVETIKKPTNQDKQNGSKRSMDVFLNNPENQDLIKK